VVCWHAAPRLTTLKTMRSTCQDVHLLGHRGKKKTHLLGHDATVLMHSVVVGRYIL
jgi:hypothetical protein